MALRTSLILFSIAALVSSTAALAQTGSQKDAHTAPPGRAAGGLFARMDKNGDGKIEKAEARTAATELFTRMDRNGDGAVTQDEQPDMPHAKRHVRRSGDHFARMDKNGDGKIERSETRLPEEHFTKADSNKDGKLTKEEMQAAFREMAKARKAERFAEFDSNADGKIDKKEALLHADQRFTELDGNKDGKVTHEEAHQGLSARHHGKRGGHHDCKGQGKKASAAKGHAI